ncbi:MAG: glycerol-3-phosphate dehydrogenase/oxidase [Flavobacteriales bacterium]
MQEQFSASLRKSWIAQLPVCEYDLLVIGGGITGAGIALDAASRGLTTLLIEKKDFGWGTSSRSTKLIHGGLRYLKQLEFALVYNVGRERKIAYRNAPYLVHPERMMLPFVKHGSLSPLAASFGLWLYELLAGVRKGDKRKILSKESSLLLEPLLSDDGLKGSAIYSEYRTDDARLVIEILKTAVHKGAHAINYAKAIETIKDDSGQVCGVLMEDQMTGKRHTIKARSVVNAAGPWVDEVRKSDGKVKGKHLKLTKGVHIVIPYPKFPLAQSIYFDVGDGRMIFAIPRNGVVYAGTTDTFYDGDLEKVYADQTDVAYILKAINQTFPKLNLSFDDVESTWAGLRPLIYEEGKSASEISRKDEIFVSISGLISIAGGKLTGYRLMAKKVTNLVVKSLRKSKSITKALKSSHTQHIPLCGHFDHVSVEAYIDQLCGEATQIQANPPLIRRWVQSYGAAAEHIVEHAYQIWPNFSHEQKGLVPYFAEIEYAIKHEMVLQPLDFYLRRTGMLYFELPQAQILLDATADFLFEHLKITDEQIQKAMLNNVREEIAGLIGFKNERKKRA